MPAPSRLPEQRRALLPILADAFTQLGYRRATTAELARRCGVRENILYRHWPDKAAMFTAALEHVHDSAIATWRRVLTESDDPRRAAERLLDHEAEHLGEHGYHRIIFSALGETDDPAIEATLRRMYRSFYRLVHRALVAARGDSEREPDATLTAWAILGLGTMATIGGEVGALSSRRRSALIARVGRALIAGREA